MKHNTVGNYSNSYVKKKVFNTLQILKNSNFDPMKQPYLISRLSFDWPPDALWMNSIQFHLSLRSGFIHLGGLADVFLFVLLPTRFNV